MVRLIPLLALLFVPFALTACSVKTRTITYIADQKLVDAREKVNMSLHQNMRLQGLRIGDPIFIRVLKQERILELWIKAQDQDTYALFKTYPICYFSGDLGPKLKEGDKQAPEGFYDITQGRLHPESENHLAFNIGFPNAYDTAHGRTGSYLMIHGGCRSVGCFAMTDPVIEEIYVLAEAALENGQEKVDVHIFPFAMTEQNLIYHGNSEWSGFWQTLNVAYQSFERKHVPPIIKVDEAGNYRFFELKHDPGHQSATRQTAYDVGT